MAKFKIRASRFIKQIGQKEPEYVKADPDNPVVVNVEIPPGRKPDAFLEPLDAPDKLKPYYAEKPKRAEPATGPTEADMYAAQARIAELEEQLAAKNAAAGELPPPPVTPPTTPAAEVKPVEQPAKPKRPSDGKPS